MPLFLLGVLVYAGLHVVSFGWLVSIATSPTAIGSRKRFLEHTEEAVKNLLDLGQSPEPAQLESLKNDLALLRVNLKEGWAETDVFIASCRIAVWKFGAHSRGAITGFGALAGNVTNSAVDAAFPKPPPETAE